LVAVALEDTEVITLLEEEEVLAVFFLAGFLLLQFAQ
jgi:hypothetical protein